MKIEIKIEVLQIKKICFGVNKKLKIKIFFLYFLLFLNFSYNKCIFYVLNFFFKFLLLGGFLDIMKIVK